MPRCPDAQMPRCPDAQMPRCPDAQMCDDERYAVLFTSEKTIFPGCDVDGGWSQIGAACHPERYSKNPVLMATPLKTPILMGWKTIF